jgi:flagellar assembly protein FliH
MSTSSSAQARQSAPDANPSPAPFPYSDATETISTAGPVSDEAENNRRQAEMLEQARQRGQQEARAELLSSRAEDRELIARAVRNFDTERADYSRRIEGEVVRLALAIARKILHREVQLDPRALAGIVRVTLESMENSTKVSLYVPPREATEWRHYFASNVEGESALDVHEDALLNSGECRIETALGATTVGFESQLLEIETGLLDLLAERPGTS